MDTSRSRSRCARRVWSATTSARRPVSSRSSMSMSRAGSTTRRSSRIRIRSAITAASLGSLLCWPPLVPCRARFTARPGTCTTVSPPANSIASAKAAIPPKMSIPAVAGPCSASAARTSSTRPAMAWGVLPTAWLASTCPVWATLITAQCVSLATSMPTATGTAALPSSAFLTCSFSPPALPYIAIGRSP